MNVDEGDLYNEQKPIENIVSSVVHTTTQYMQRAWRATALASLSHPHVTPTEYQSMIDWISSELVETQ